MILQIRESNDLLVLDSQFNEIKRFEGNRESVSRYLLLEIQIYFVRQTLQAMIIIYCGIEVKDA